jgi:hypothetical protein
MAPCHFRSPSQAEEENGQSSIHFGAHWLGNHWGFDKTEGIKQGNRVADYVFDNSFRRRTHRRWPADEE